MSRIGRLAGRLFLGFLGSLAGTTYRDIGGVNDLILQEDGFALLQEDGFNLLQET